VAACCCCWQAVAGRGMFCFHPKGNLCFPREGTTAQPSRHQKASDGQFLLRVLQPCSDKNASSVTPSGWTRFWGCLKATLKQTCIWSVKALVERGTVGTKWCPSKLVQGMREPQKLHTTQGNHQDFPTVRPDQTRTCCFVLANSELVGPTGFP